MAKSTLSGGVGISGSKTVTTAGTAVQLDTSTLLLWMSVCIRAKPTNTGRIYIGGSTTDGSPSTVASTTNYGLGAGEALTFTPTRGHSLDLSKIWIDASVNGEGVDYYAVA